MLLFEKLCQLALQLTSAKHANSFALSQSLRNNLRQTFASFAFKQVNRCFRSIMTILHSRSLGFKIFISLQRRVDFYRTHNLCQHFIGNAARSQDSGNSARCIHHGGFQTDAAVAAIKHTGNFPLHILQHILCIRRAWTAGNIGRRRRNRATAGTDKVLREFIGWEAYGDSFQSCAYSVRHNRGFVDNQCQRSRPKMLHKLFGISIQTGSQLRNIFFFSNMQNQRIIVRSALGSKNLGYSLRIQTIRTQAVNCFRRERHNLARTD